LNDVGDRQKSNDQDLGAVETDAIDPFFRISMMRLDGRGNLVISSGISDSSTG